MSPTHLHGKFFCWFFTTSHGASRPPLAGEGLCSPESLGSSSLLPVPSRPPQWPQRGRARAEGTVGLWPAWAAVGMELTGTRPRGRLRSSAPAGTAGPAGAATDASLAGVHVLPRWRGQAEPRPREVAGATAPRGVVRETRTFHRQLLSGTRALLARGEGLQNQGRPPRKPAHMRRSTQNQANREPGRPHVALAGFVTLEPLRMRTSCQAGRRNITSHIQSARECIAQARCLEPCPLQGLLQSPLEAPSQATRAAELRGNGGEVPGVEGRAHRRSHGRG